jgi:hypothetical protein
MKNVSRWPKKPVSWGDKDTLYISVPFTWNMPAIINQLQSRLYPWAKTVIGGPGAYLFVKAYPDLLKGLPVEIRDSYPVHPRVGGYAV